VGVGFYGGGKFDLLRWLIFNSIEKPISCRGGRKWAPEGG